jgi:hypothetical protein
MSWRNIQTVSSAERGLRGYYGTYRFRAAKGFWIRGATAVCILALRALAQTETGQIIGTVLDPASAVVVNAKVTLKAAGTGLAHQTVTNADRIYRLSNLPSGGYTVSVAAPGFAGIEQRVVVTVGRKIRVTFGSRSAKPEP